jgi:hypothetical protein
MADNPKYERWAKKLKVQLDKVGLRYMWQTE